MSLSIRKVGLLSLIGGVAGGISALIASFLLNVFPTGSFFVLIPISSMIYGFSGLAIGHTLNLVLQLRKYRLVIAGFCGGSLFGLCAGLGTFGYYAAFISMVLCLGAGVGGKDGVRVVIWGIIGILFSIFLETIGIIVLYSIYGAIFSKGILVENGGILLMAVTFYWMNFGTLFAFGQKGQTL